MAGENHSDDEGLNGFHRLVLQSERSSFTFYGYRMAADGRYGHGYFKLAHSLGEALADLVEENEGVADMGRYLVRDAFLEASEDGPVLHVELTSVREILEALEEGDKS